MAFQVDGDTVPSMQSTTTKNKWDEAKDKILIREVRLQQPFLERIGSKEAGLKWTEIANSLNAHPLFKESANHRDQRSARDSFNRLLSDFNAKMRKEESSSGSSPDDLTEVELAFEEIQYMIVNSLRNKPPEVQASERSKAMQIRDKAMKTWSQTGRTDEGKSDSEESSDSVTETRSSRKKRRGSDALEYLQMRQSSDCEIRKEEIKIKKHQVEMEQKKLELEMKRQDQMQSYLLEQQRQAVVQQQQQQQQIQQQMQMQLQMIALLAKLSGSKSA